MRHHLTSIAESRLAAGATPPQRYGLSIMLRKAYPAVGNRHPTPPSLRHPPSPRLRRTSGSGRQARLRGAGLETGDWKATVRGAEPRTVGWDELPPELLALVRRRVQEDTLTAAHVLRSGQVHVLRVERDATLALEGLGTPGEFTTIVVEVAPEKVVTIQESRETAIVYYSTSAEKDSDEALVHEPVYGSTLIVLRLGVGARVRWFGQSVAAPAFAVTERLALLGQDAQLEQFSALVAPNALRENLHVVLAAPGATARVGTLFIGSRDHQIDLGVTAEHRAPNTTSDLRAKGVLSGKAQAVVRGLVRVEKQAKGSDGYQRCDALLLSPTAEVDPIPNLEIETNDVRCTHGVTVSHVNAEHLFYLQSRGLGEGAARDLLVDGFTGTMLRSYPEQRQEELRTAIQNVLRTP